MRRRKKQGSILKKLFILSLALLFIVLFVIQLFAGKLLTNLINTKSGDFLKGKTTVGSIYLNPLSGSVGLNDLKILNPPAFSEGELYSLKETFYNFSWLALLKKTIKIESVFIDSSNLYIEKNKEGNLNIGSLLKETTKPEKTPDVTIPETAEEVPAPIETKKEAVKAKKPISTKIPLKAVIEDLHITSLINFADLENKKPFNISLDTLIEISNLKTFGDVSEKGNIYISSNLKNAKNEFITTIKVEVSPISDLATPTFKSTSNIKAVNMEKFAAYSEKTGIEKGMLSIESNIVCENGMIIKEQSTQKIKITNLVLAKKMKDKLKGQTPPSELSFTFHLFGNVCAPQNDFMLVFIQTILNPNNIVGAQISQKITKELSKNKDAQKFLAASGLGASLGLSATEEPAKEAVKTETAKEEIKPEVPAVIKEPQKAPVVTEEVTPKTPITTEEDKLETELKKAEKKAKDKLAAFKEKLF